MYVLTYMSPCVRPINTIGPDRMAMLKARGALILLVGYPSHRRLLQVVWIVALVACRAWGDMHGLLSTLPLAAAVRESDEILEGRLSSQLFTYPLARFLCVAHLRLGPP